MWCGEVDVDDEVEVSWGMGEDSGEVFDPEAAGEFDEAIVGVEERGVIGEEVEGAEFAVAFAEGAGEVLEVDADEFDAFVVGVVVGDDLLERGEVSAAVFEEDDGWGIGQWLIKEGLEGEEVIALSVGGIGSDGLAHAAGIDGSGEDDEERLVDHCYPLEKGLREARVF